MAHGRGAVVDVSSARENSPGRFTFTTQCKEKRRRPGPCRDYIVTTTPGQSTRSMIDAGSNTAGHGHFWPTPMNGGNYQD